jgi:hypothetical protein
VSHEIFTPYPQAVPAVAPFLFARVDFALAIARPERLPTDTACSVVGAFTDTVSVVAGPKLISANPHPAMPSTHAAYRLSADTSTECSTFSVSVKETVQDGDGTETSIGE